MLPNACALPADIADLAGLQFLRVSETHLTAGLDHLATAITAVLPDLDPGPSPTTVAQPDPGRASVSMTSHVSDGGSSYQAAGDQTINFGIRNDGPNATPV